MNYVRERVHAENYGLALAMWMTWGMGDTFSTMLAVEALGLHVELNPFVRGILHTGPLAFVSVKFLGTAVIVALILNMDLSESKTGRGVTITLAILGGVVTVLNVLAAVTAA